MQSKTVGVVGLGRIGSQFVDWLLADGYDVVVNDVDEGKVESAREAGARPADTPAAVAEAASVVLLSLPGNEYVEAVMESEGGVLEGLSAGQVVVDTGTTSPDVEVFYAEACDQRGAGYVDAPLTYGGPPNEGGGSPLTMFVGGADAHYESAREVIETVSNVHSRFGGVGSGQVMKAGHRLRQNCRAAVDAEMVEFLRNNGVDPEAAAALLGWDLEDRHVAETYPDTRGFREAIEASDPDTASLAENGFRVDDDRARPRLRQPSWMKDHAYALEIAHSSNTATPVLSTVYQMLLGVQNYAEALARRELEYGDGLESGWEGRRDVISHYRRLNRPAEEWQRLVAEGEE